MRRNIRVMPSVACCSMRLHHRLIQHQRSFEAAEYLGEVAISRQELIRLTQYLFRHRHRLIYLIRGRRSTMRSWLLGSTSLVLCPSTLRWACSFRAPTSKAQVQCTAKLEEKGQPPSGSTRLSQGATVTDGTLSLRHTVAFRR